MRIPRHLAAAALAVGLIALAGCSGDPGGNAGSSSDASSSALPSFSTVTLDGAEFTSAELEGRPSVLWFWAPWCSTCDAESPEIAAAAAELGPDVEIIGVGALGPLFDAEAFVEFNELQGVRHLFDEEADVWAKFGVLAQPAFAFINSDGTYSIAPGIMDAEQIVERARELS
jgi:thiol-disulfide isomerase/thioredoxin